MIFTIRSLNYHTLMYLDKYPHLDCCYITKFQPFIMAFFRGVSFRLLVIQAKII